MIGDDLQTDIKGAVDFGMPCIYFNPHNVQHPYKLSGDVPDLLSIKLIL